MHNNSSNNNNDNNNIRKIRIVIRLVATIELEQ